MSILESFYLLFETNSDDVEQGTKKAKGAADRLNKSLDETKDSSSRLGASLLNVAHQFTGALLGSLSVGTILAGVKASAMYANELHKASQTIGTSVEGLDAWGKAVEKNGGTTDGFVQTVKSLTENLNEVDINGMRPASQEFEKLGIRITDTQGRLKSVVSLLPEIASSFEKLSKAKSFNLGKSLGLDEGTITLLQRGKREVDAAIARQKELGIVTKEDAEIAAKFNEQWSDTDHAFRSLFTTISTTILPIFTVVAKAFERVAVFFKRHSDFIVGSLIAIGSALLYIVTPAIVSLIASFGPFIIIAGLFALLYDDIQNFLKGNASLLGDIIAKYPIVGEILRSIGYGLKTFTANSVEALKEISQFLGGLAFSIENAWKSVVDFILTSIEKITNAYNSVKSFLGFGDTKIIGELQSAKNTMSLANNTPISSMSSSSILANTRNSNRNTSIQTGPITIETQATDPQGIAAGLGDALDIHLSQTQANFDDGLLA